MLSFFFFFSSRRRHTRLQGDWSSDVCSSDLHAPVRGERSDEPSSTSLICSYLAAGIPARAGHQLMIARHRRERLAGSQEIGRASCREKGCATGGRGDGKEERTNEVRAARRAL